MPVQTLLGTLDDGISLFCFETPGKPHEGVQSESEGFSYLDC